MDINNATQNFRRNYSGPRIAFLISGGGYSCLNFRQLPGASRILEQAVEPYSPLSFADFLNNNCGVSDFDENSRFCDENILNPAIQAMENHAGSGNVLSVVVTAALTTDRFRQGRNRAFIALSDGRRFRLNLPKLEQNAHETLLNNAPHLIDEQRSQEDAIVGQVVLAVIMNDPTMMPNLPQGASLDNLTPASV